MQSSLKIVIFHIFLYVYQRVTPLKKTPRRQTGCCLRSKSSPEGLELHQDKVHSATYSDAYHAPAGTRSDKKNPVNSRND